MAPETGLEPQRFRDLTAREQQTWCARIGRMRHRSARG